MIFIRDTESIGLGTGMAGEAQNDGEIQKERTLFEESAPFVILTVYYLAAEFEVEPVITNVVASAVSAVTRLDLQ